MPTAYVYYRANPLSMQIFHTEPSSTARQQLEIDGWQLVSTSQYIECLQCADRKPLNQFPLLNCGHNHVCRACIITNYTNRIRKCPVCREAITAAKFRSIRTG